MTSLLTSAKQLLSRASGHHKAGDIVQAIRLCQKALAVFPGNPDAQHMLGVLYLKTGKNREAALFLSEAVKHNETSASLTHLGIALQNLGRNEEAVAVCKRAVSLNNGNFSAYNTLGNALRELSRTDEAIECFRTALSLKSDVPEIYFNLANIYRETGRPDDAVASLLKVIEMRPQDCEAYNLLGNVLNRQEKFEAAEACYRNALGIRPEYIEALYNLGNVLRRLKKYEEAVTLYTRALELKADFADAWFSLGDALHSLGRYHEAIENYGNALRLRPESAEIYNGMGNTYREMCKGDEALFCYRKAAELKPDFAEVYYNISNLHLDNGNAEEAIEFCKKALAISPDLAEAQWNMALALLTKGDLEEGWRKYEWRFLKKDAVPPPFDLPDYEGLPLKGRSILICAEQGVGDEIMFASCLPEVISAADSCVVECDRRLMPLFSRSFPEASFFERKNSAAEMTAVNAGIDWKVAIGTLPRYFRPDIQSFSKQKTYLLPDPDRLRMWKERYAALGPGLNVGISWRGGKDSYVRNIRSTTLDQWAEVLRTKGLHFINLQYGECSEEIREAEEKMGVVIHDWEDADPLSDLDGFAAQIAALDLVISVDNSTVHMAGALGREVWTLLPFGCDWRWMRGYEDTPWYPSMRLFRQRKAGEWSGVFRAVCESLGKVLSNTEDRIPEVQPKSYTSLMRKPSTKSRGSVLLLNDTSNWYHWGCNGTSTAIHREVREKGFTVESVAIQGIYRMKNPPAKIGDFDSGEFLEDFSRANQWIVRQIKDSDVVLINGEGSLHGLTDYTLNLLYLAYASKMHFNKNVQIINHSCYPEISPDLKDTPSWEIYRKVYSVIDYAAIREPASLELMRRAGLRVHRSFDCLPLYISAEYNGAPEVRTERIVLAPPVAWKLAGINVFAAYIDRMQSEGHETVVLTGAPAFPASDDEEFVERLKATGVNGWRHIKAGSMKEWLDCISSAGVLVSGRFHHAIAAAVLGTPFILLDSNTPKNRGIAEVLNAETPVSLEESGLLRQMADRTEDALSRNAGRSGRYMSKVEQLCALAKENFTGLPGAE